MFTKLFSSITDSTIWREPDHVRLVWITMLAKCDKHGIVYASVPGLADAARVTIESCQDALKRLGSPDEWSRSKEMEGRRIEEVEGGWILINHAKYKRIKDADERREYVREKVQIYRARKQVVNNVNNVNTGKPGKHIRSDQIRSESDKKIASNKAKVLTDCEFIDSLKANPAYTGLDISEQLGKMDSWLLANPGRQKTRRFIVNWLNRCEKPVLVQGKEPGKKYSFDFLEKNKHETKNPN